VAHRHRDRRRWRAVFGAQHWPVARREPLVLNPLIPHRRVIRVVWSEREPRPAAAELVAGLTERHVLDRLWLPLCGMALALFVLLPMGLFGRLGLYAIGAALALYYACALAALGWVWFRRSRAQITASALTGVALQILLCPPLGLNLVRKVSLATQPRDLDLFAVAGTVFNAEDLVQAKLQCASRIDERIDLLDPQDPRLPALQRCKERFAFDEETLQ
jgi:hypothetical protein